MKLLKLYSAIAILLLIPLLVDRAEQPSARQMEQTDFEQRQFVADRILSNKSAGITYAVGYERYGFLGMYHVSMFVDAYNHGVHVQRLHIDGAGRFPKLDINFGLFDYKFTLLPGYLAGHVNPQGHIKHFLGLINSHEVGPVTVLNEEQGTKLLNMAHNAVVVLNTNDRILYFTFPVRVGPWDFWTSNSVVASLVKAANDDGIKVPFPAGGYYPGFSGPFLSKSLYE